MRFFNELFYFTFYSVALIMINYLEKKEKHLLL